MVALFADNHFSMDIWRLRCSSGTSIGKVSINILLHHPNIKLSIRTIERSVTSRYQGSSHVCMVPLDLKNPSSQRRTSASSNDGRKYGLPCSSYEQPCTGKSYMSFFSFFFSAIARPRFLEIQKFSTLATWRNDFSLNRRKFKPSIAILQLFSGWSQQNYASRQHRTQDVAYHPQGPKLT